jgi:class 3 adenylate cyclase
MTYRALKAHFQLDDDLLETLKEELLYSQPQVRDDQGRGLCWTGEVAASSEPAAVVPEAQPAQAASLPPVPPPLEAERRQLTVMFADLVDSTTLSGDKEHARTRLTMWRDTP